MLSRLSPSKGEGWEGVTPQVFGDRRTHAFEVRQHLVVPEAQNPVALVLEGAGSLCFLRRRPLVLAAVNFDDQARIMANKVGNLTPQRHLPAESVPVNLIQSQDSPNAFLGVSHISS